MKNAYTKIFALFSLKPERVFIFLLFLFFVVKSTLLIYPDLNMDYPFLTPDSYDWIANSYHYAGYDVNFSFRAPGLPLLMLLLGKFNMLNFLPIFNQIALFLLILFSFKLLRNYFSLTVSVITTVVIFINSFLQNFSLYILADIYCLLFIFIGFYFYLFAINKESNYIRAILFWSISFLFQYAIIFALPAILCHFIIFRRKIKLSTIIISATTFIITIGPWMLYKKIKFGSFIHAGNAQTELLNIHFDSFAYYLVGTISTLGILVFAFIVFGILFSFFEKKSQRKKFSYLLSLIGFFWVIFWIILYDGNDKRFTIYLLFFLFPFIAFCLSLIEKLLTKFKETRKQIALITITTFLAMSSYIYYSSPFVYNEIKLTKTQEIQFDAFMSRAYYNPNINFRKFKLRQDKEGFNALNLIELYKIKNDFKPSAISENLAKVMNEIEKRKIKSLCANYTIENKYQWYIDKNKFGNYFKRRLEAYPECKEVNIYISDTEIKLYQ